MMNHAVNAVFQFVYRANPTMTRKNIEWLKLGHPAVKINL